MQNHFFLSNKISEKFRTRPSWRNLEMDSKLPRSNRNGPRVADFNHDSIAKKHLEKAEANTKYQDLRRTTRIRKSTKLFDAHVKMDIENEAKKIYKRPTTFMLRNLPFSLRARYRIWVTMNGKLPNVKDEKSCSRWSKDQWSNKTYHYQGFLRKIIKYRPKWTKSTFF